MGRVEDGQGPRPGSLCPGRGRSAVIPGFGMDGRRRPGS
ncbi:MAG: hypothetical protein AVDCRST_MAG49-2859 [uncultured Thermomicrobiales bacterium]|uniref:Uncharacterized protein n=1 Tax=uncultured Thermomicrobiales bacterium TaxID=1645740 RepID=A0A6J4V2X2_9BACT|nr:MAG: hypothetical protein AVDCRST_MAG49-2859 [uncultured Thermomicrobiales bacterium]